jgi:tetratricopeptide (TPR) repeat protein
LYQSQLGIGDLHMQFGDAEAAATHFRECAAICEGRLRDNPDEYSGQRNLSVAYERLGDAAEQLGDLQAAMDFQWQSFNIRERLTAVEPDNLERLHDLSIVCSRLGDLRVLRGEHESALQMFQRYNQICEQLVTAGFENTELQRDLAISFGRVADMQLALGDLEESLANYRRYYEISQKWAAVDPDNPRAQRSMMIACDRVGDVQRMLDLTAEALEFHRKAVDAAERSAAIEPDNAEIQWDLMCSRYQLADTLRASFEYESSVAEFGITETVLNEIIAHGHRVEESQAVLESLRADRQAVADEAALAQAAVGPWEDLISRTDHASLLPLRIRQLARAGRFAEIPQSAAMLSNLDAENPDNLYIAACGYALCAKAIHVAEGTELTPEQQTQPQEYIDLAVTCLRESIAAGYGDVEHLRQDPDLAVLRELPEFEELIHLPPAPALPE